MNRVARWHWPLSLMLVLCISGIVCSNNRMSIVALVALVIFVQLEKLQSCGKPAVDVANNLQVLA